MQPCLAKPLPACFDKGMTARIFIDGQVGTTGLGIAQRLRVLPGVELVGVAEADRKQPAARQAAMARSDLTILCLPDEAARESVAMAEALGRGAPKLLDASTAHRTAPGWAYGFAELAEGQGARIAVAPRVANPGCYATGAIALLRPLVAAGLIAPETPLSISAVSGYSGGGNAMIASHERDGGPAFELYGLGLSHKHLPEIVAHAGLARVPIFIPSVAHVRQGMIVCIGLQPEQMAAGTTDAMLREALADWYPAEGQVRVVAPDESGRMQPDTLDDTDEMELTVFGHADRGQAVLVARLDNLGKGASGAAVQNTKLMLGLAL